MPKLECSCERCGKTFLRWPHEAKGRTWCSQTCHMKTMNEERNPTRWQTENRTRAAEKIQTVKETVKKPRTAKRTEDRPLKTYKKVAGRHLHRIVAEQMLGRPLKTGEVVHHINGNKLDNRPENLKIFSSQAEHARWHMTINNPRKKVIPCGLSPTTTSEQELSG